MMRHGSRYLPATLWFAATLTLGACSQLPQRQPPAAAPVPQTGQAAHQVYRDWHFPADGVTFSNRLPDARLNGVKRLGRYEYQVTIAPESVPINPSPWYGFSVRSASERQITIHFHYLHGKQRYVPKLSRDGSHWHTAGERQFTVDAAGQATLKLQTGKEPTRVFAQVPLTAADYRQWQTGLAQRIELAPLDVGQSLQGRPIHGFTLGNPGARRLLVVIGRQHPPETTGARALMAFVDTLAADEPDARRFRAQVLTLVIPLLNPDGVAAGNWRGNANGVDLNRDWGIFREPETRAARDTIDHLLADGPRSLALAIDFHSTWKDIFYIVSEDPSTRPDGLLGRLIAHMRERFPGQIRVKANAAKGSVFKNWVYRHYHAPAVTYEVGDRSNAEAARKHARFAARTLITLLAPAAGGEP